MRPPSLDKAKTLSDSNGFVSTLELKGKITVELKLDWIFVKPAQLTDPDDRQTTLLSSRSSVGR